MMSGFDEMLHNSRYNMTNNIVICGEAKKIRREQKKKSPPLQELTPAPEDYPMPHLADIPYYESFSSNSQIVYNKSAAAQYWPPLQPTTSIYTPPAALAVSSFKWRDPNEGSSMAQISQHFTIESWPMADNIQPFDIANQQIYHHGQSFDVRAGIISNNGQSFTTGNEYNAHNEQHLRPGQMPQYDFKVATEQMLHYGQPFAEGTIKKAPNSQLFDIRTEIPQDSPPCTMSGLMANTDNSFCSQIGQTPHISQPCCVNRNGHPVLQHLPIENAHNELYPNTYSENTSNVTSKNPSTAVNEEELKQVQIMLVNAAKTSELNQIPQSSIKKLTRSGTPLRDENKPELNIAKIKLDLANNIPLQRMKLASGEIIQSNTSESLITKEKSHKELSFVSKSKLVSTDGDKSSNSNCIDNIIGHSNPEDNNVKNSCKVKDKYEYVDICHKPATLLSRYKIPHKAKTENETRKNINNKSKKKNRSEIIKKLKLKLKKVEEEIRKRQIDLKIKNKLIKQELTLNIDKNKNPDQCRGVEENNKYTNLIYSSKNFDGHTNHHHQPSLKKETEVTKNKIKFRSKSTGVDDTKLKCPSKTVKSIVRVVDSPKESHRSHKDKYYIIHQKDIQRSVHNYKSSHSENNNNNLNKCNIRCQNTQFSTNLPRDDLLVVFSNEGKHQEKQTQARKVKVQKRKSSSNDSSIKTLQNQTKIRKIELIINVISEKSNENIDKSLESESFADLSFLDDINADEIVEYLNTSDKQGNTCESDVITLNSSDAQTPTASPPSQTIDDDIDIGQGESSSNAVLDDTLIIDTKNEGCETRLNNVEIDTKLEEVKIYGRNIGYETCSNRQTEHESPVIIVEQESHEVITITGDTLEVITINDDTQETFVIKVDPSESTKEPNETNPNVKDKSVEAIVVKEENNNNNIKSQMDQLKEKEKSKEEIQAHEIQENVSDIKQVLPKVEPEVFVVEKTSAEDYQRKNEYPEVKISKDVQENINISKIKNEEQSDDHNIHVGDICLNIKDLATQINYLESLAEAKDSSEQNLVTKITTNTNVNTAIKKYKIDVYDKSRETCQEGIKKVVKLVTVDKTMYTQRYIAKMKRIASAGRKKELITKAYLELMKSWEEEIVLAQKLEDRVSEYMNLDLLVASVLHRGTYSILFNCIDPEGLHVTAKVMNIKEALRRNTMSCYGKEAMITKIQDSIPKEKLGFVYMITGLSVEGKWCFLMEYYPKNLEQALRESGKGFHINMILKLAKQLVAAVVTLRNNGIVHSDIRPTHILLDAKNTTLKLCGFDDSYHVEKAQKRSNIGTIHYRAPEIILGHSAGHSIDTWAAACVLNEMVTNQKLFPGTTNNEVLYQHMSMLGDVPWSTIEKSAFKDAHFVGEKFLRRRFCDGDRGVKILREEVSTFPKNDTMMTNLIKAYVHNWSTGKTKAEKDDHIKKLHQIYTALTQMLFLDPERRVSILNVNITL